MRDDAADAEKEPLVEEDDELLYPKRIIWPLQYTCVLPFASCAVALTTGFYGLACLSFCLGLTSVAWWWYPYKANWMRQVDRFCVLICALYAFYVEEQIREPHRFAWKASLCMVCGCVLVNESASFYFKITHSEEEHRRSCARYILPVHALCAHVMLNVLTCCLMVAYVVYNGEDSIKFRNASDAPDMSLPVHLRGSPFFDSAKASFQRRQWNS
eukprot:TRINITY_DN104193_c0_g1_i1.p1 TRINITY_DN104193_c0_g1~~TRINITY_DN104193_c0_g1_i1.p1  ORF type:complete len:214 (+),score=28.78 TRINITY_DN104193_c0_g1_i1:164-805(+)